MRHEYDVTVAAAVDSPAEDQPTTLRTAPPVGRRLRRPRRHRTDPGVLTALLPQLDPDTHGLHAPLETLQETSLRDGIALRDERLRAWLATVGGSGRAARTARRLLG